jgi:hypothetical protein
MFSSGAVPASASLDSSRRNFQMETSRNAEHELTSADRRRHPRTLSHTTAVLTRKTFRAEYEVCNLSVAGALLRGGPEVDVGTIVEVVLHMPLYPDIKVGARVVRRGLDEDDVPCLGVEFLHTSDVTEDHIQSALLSEIERSQTHGLIPTLD